jgi:hypothetical protein
MFRLIATIADVHAAKAHAGEVGAEQYARQICPTKSSSSP